MGVIKTEFPLEHHLAQRVVDRPPFVHFTPQKPDGIEPHPNPIDLAGGCPNNGMFPVDSMVLNMIEKPFQTNTNTKKDFEESLKFPGNDPKKSTIDLNPVGAFVNHPTSVTNIKTVITKETGSVKNPINIKDSFQYQSGVGFPNLLKFIKNLIEKVHDPGYKNYSAIINNGAGDGLSKIFSILVNPGDIVLVEEFTFIPTVWSIVEYGGNTHPIELNLDEDGINVKVFEDLLDNWYYLNPNKKKPTILYTIASGQNPTGLTQTYENRKKIYQLCQKHDIMIVEDDPYGYLVLPSYKSNFKFDESMTVDNYVNNYITKSYMHFDTEGRVIRSETFSKMIAPGVRLGFVVCHDFFIKKLTQYTMITTKFPSGTSQTIVNSIIEYWGGVNGFLKWGIEICKIYQHRKNLFIKSFSTTSSYLTKKADVIDPTAGMFIAIKLNAPKGADFKKMMEQINTATYIRGVNVVCSGTTLALNEKVTKMKGNLLRISIVYVSNDDNELIEGVFRLNQCIEDVFKQNGW